MSRYVCPNCKAKNKEEQQYCKKCNAWLGEAVRHRRNYKIVKNIFTSAVVLLLIVGIIYFFTSPMFEEEREALLNRISQGSQPETMTTGSSRTNPVDIGEVLTVDLLQESLQDPSVIGKFKIGLEVLEIMRGAEALRHIKDEYIFNPEPEEGYEYILVNMRVDVIQAEEQMQYTAHPSHFTAVSSTGKDYPLVMNVAIKDDLYAKLYEGASHTGWVTVKVEVGDDAPVLTFLRDEFGQNGLWFKLY